VEVKAEGKLESWPVKGWSDGPGLAVEAGAEKGTFLIKIDKSAVPGPHLIRAYNEDGASPPRIFIVSETPSLREAEPNDEPRKAQRVAATLPVTIEGQLEKPGDVDCYAIKLQAGQQLVAAVAGRRLGAPMDPMLHLLDAKENELAFAHDGLGLDPLLAWRAASAGTYIVRISAFAYPPAADVKLTGGKADVYRLTLTTGPAARFALPAGVRRGEKGKLRLLGAEAIAVVADATRALDDFVVAPAPATVDGWLRVPVGDGPELLADELMKSGEPLAAPVSITGVLANPGDEHRFKLAVKKGEAFRLIAQSGSLNSPMDAVVRVEDADGRELARGNGNGGVADTSAGWNAPADGVYRVAVADLFHKGGDDYLYRLEIVHPKPGVTATIDNHAYRLVAGKTAAIKVTITRRDGHAAPLVAVASGLPAGVTASSAEVPEKGGDVTLTLSAAADVKGFNGVIRIAVLGTDVTHPEAWPARYDLHREKETAEELLDWAEPWLTVAPAPPATVPSTAPAPPATVPSTAPAPPATVPSTAPASKPAK
jgi:hypothetical protein